MRRRTFVYVACSPHPRVGTTLTANLLTDYFVMADRAVMGFDTNPYDGDFARAHPKTTSVIDIAATRGQIDMFDRLVVPDETPKVVDLWHPAYRRFFAVAEEVGFIEEAARAGVTPIMLFHADASQASREACWHLATKWEGIEIAVVSNEGAAPPDPSQPGHLSRFPTEHGFRIPKLDAACLTAINNPAMPLAELLWDAPDDAPPPPDRLVEWTQSIFAQFKAFELRHALEDAEYLW